MEAQGYEIETDIIFQDNQIVIIIDNERKKSCAGKYIHIDINYLSMKYRVDSNIISISYCITEHILANCFTKALQVALFIKLR